MFSMTRIASKVLSIDEAVRRFGRSRTDRVVFTNGCFDVLHRGHVEYLEFARSLGDRLVLGLNSDRSVRVLKGEGRPINPVEDRAFVLAALESVSAVVVFEEDTPLELISALLPDVLVKGGDYSIDGIVGADQVRAAGGEVIVAPLIPGRSTTAMLSRARQKGNQDEGS
jgi:D-beta-D-heptose 7-phosphate kinase/D-beta-D-heptose 1-phosphate adenosyltransferase